MEISLSQAAIAVLITFVLSFIWMKKGEHVRRQDQIGLTLSLLGSFALLITVFDRRKNQMKDINNATHTLVFDELKNQQDNFVGLIEKFKSNYPESFILYDEMFNVQGKDLSSSSQHQHIDAMKAQLDPYKRELVEQVLSNSVYQTVENYLSIATLTLPITNQQWIIRMLQWFTSPILQTNFSKYKQNYAPDVVAFINNLITNANALQNDLNNGADSTPELYKKYASQVTFTPRVVKQQ